MVSELSEAVRHPGYEPKPHSAGMWEVHSRYLHSFIPGISWKKLATWSQDDVANFIKNVPGCAKASTILKEQVRVYKYKSLYLMQISFTLWLNVTHYLNLIL